MLEMSLQKYFRYSSFRPGQKEVVQSILDGKNTLAMLPTGTGKSLCYQLPAYMMGKTALIVSPLVSLMQDQVEQLKMNGEKKAIALNSFLQYREREEAFRQLEAYQFIFLSPEMLSNRRVLPMLKGLDIGLFVVDEAHCISQWGYDFRPNYLGIGKIRKELGNPLTLALTATATSDVRSDIKRFLGLEKCEEIIASVDRKNIGIFVEELNTYEEKDRRLIELISTLEKPGIVYFSSKKMANQVYGMLLNLGMNDVGVYHADLLPEERVLMQQQFLQSQVNIVCATSAFGMGINKDNVRYIIHYHLPQSMEAYLQEIGRAGRDGNKSAAILLYVEGDERLPEFLMESELPTRDQMMLFRHHVHKVASQKDLVTVPGLETLIGTSGFTETQQRLLLHYLNSEKTDLDTGFGLLLQLVEEGGRKKLDRWKRFLDWFRSKGCYRKGILEYFDEPEHRNETGCCSNCGHDINQVVGYRSAGNEVNASCSTIAWREELGRFLVPFKELS
ncbi:MAG: RecQ family ATP-dependent DNA helicase [Bacillus sp. (in: firmicutes)]